MKLRTTVYALAGVLCMVFVAVLLGQQQPPHEIDCLTNASIANELERAIYRGDSYILLGAGDCRIERTVKIVNREGLRIEGAGRGRTVLTWEGGVDEGPMFSLQNSAGVTFSNFKICVESDTTLVSAFDIYNACFSGLVMTSDGPEDFCQGYDINWGPGSHGNSFHDLTITDCHGTDSVLMNGIRVLLHPGYQNNPNQAPCWEAESDCRNGGHVFNEVHITNTRDSAWVIEGHQSVGNVFRHVHCRAIWNTFLKDLYGYGDDDDSVGAGDDDDTIEDFEVPDSDAVGNCCVRTGREDEPNTAGSFSWFGGIGNGVREAVFKIGPNPEAVHISGIYTERARALAIRNGDEDYAGVPGGVHIDSSYFNAEWLNDWNDRTNVLGTIIDLRGIGPLYLHNNVFGHTSGENLSVCWTDPDERSKDISTFVASGNAFGTVNDNPFRPSDGIDFEDDCIYPTVQESNLIYGEVGQIHSWIEMPQHFSTVTIQGVNPSMSVSRQPTSHNYFLVDGGYMKPYPFLTCIRHGVQGQRIVLVGSTGFTSIEDYGGSLSPLLPYCKNIDLDGTLPMELGPNDSLTLVKGDDDIWYEIDRSDG